MRHLAVVGIVPLLAAAVLAVPLGAASPGPLPSEAYLIERLDLPVGVVREDQAPAVDFGSGFVVATDGGLVAWSRDEGIQMIDPEGRASDFEGLPRSVAGGGAVIYRGRGAQVRLALAGFGVEALTSMWPFVLTELADGSAVFGEDETSAGFDIDGDGVISGRRVVRWSAAEGRTILGEGGFEVSADPSIVVTTGGSVWTPGATTTTTAIIGKGSGSPVAHAGGVMFSTGSDVALVTEDGTTMLGFTSRDVEIVAAVAPDVAVVFDVMTDDPEVVVIVDGVEAARHGRICGRPVVLDHGVAFRQGIEGRGCAVRVVSDSGEVVDTGLVARGAVVVPVGDHGVATVVEGTRELMVWGPGGPTGLGVRDPVEVVEGPDGSLLYSDRDHLWSSWHPADGAVSHAAHGRLRRYAFSDVSEHPDGLRTVLVLDEVTTGRDLTADGAVADLTLAVVARDRGMVVLGAAMGRRQGISPGVLADGSIVYYTNGSDLDGDSTVERDEWLVEVATPYAAAAASPSVDIDDPTSGSTTSDRRPQIGGSAWDDTMITEVEVAVISRYERAWLGVDGRWGPPAWLPADIPAGIGNGPRATDWYLPLDVDLPDGAYIIRARARDGAGKQTERSAWSNFVVDGEPNDNPAPVATIVDVDTGGGTVVVRGTAVDADGIGRIQIAVRHLDSGTWLRRNGTYRTIGWFDVRDLVETETGVAWSWVSPHPLASAEFSAVVKVTDRLGLVGPDRPRQRFSTG